MFVKKNYISIIAFSFLVWSFFIFGNANAATIDTSTSGQGQPNAESNANMYWNHTIGGSCANNILLVNATLGAGETINSATYGGNAMTLLYSKSDGTAKNVVWYILNSSAGTHEIYIATPGYEPMTGTAVSYCDVDQTNPFMSTFSVTEAATSNYRTITASSTSPVVMFTGSYDFNCGGVRYNETLLQHKSGPAWSHNWLASTSTIESESTTIGWNPCGGTNSWGYVILKDFVDNNDNFITYYGPALPTTPINTNYQFPLDYNICDTWSTSSDFYIQLLDRDNTEYYQEQLITSCSGSVIFSQPAGAVDKSFTGYFVVQEYGGSVQATSNYFINSVYTPIDLEGYINWNFTQPYIIGTASSTISTTTLWFSYNLLSDPTWSDGAKIHLRNKANNQLTSFDFTTHARTGLGYVTLSWAHNENNVYNFDFVYDNASGTDLIISRPFVVQFKSLGSITGGRATSSLEFLPPSLCVEGEVSWKNSWCYMSEDVMKPIFNKITDLLSEVFPFVLVKNIYISWNNSESASLPSNLEFLSPTNQNGDVIVALPNNWTSSTTAGLVVFGPSVFQTPNTAMANFFANLRNLTTYLFWGIFFFALYRMAKKLYIEIRE